ncbi:MAG: VOC family protein [Armatimonadetes bacterium]|nr:VOC family protein [Armatimonadota bacterium]
MDEMDHVAIACRDPEALARWYCEVLGLRIVFDSGQRPPTYLVGGSHGSLIEIMPDNGSNRAQRGHLLEPGFSHVAFRVADFEAAYAALRRADVRSLTEARPAAGGGKIAFFEDPEGNLLQIVWRERVPG